MPKSEPLTLGQLRAATADLPDATGVEFFHECTDQGEPVYQIHYAAYLAQLDTRGDLVFVEVWADTADAVAELKTRVAQGDLVDLTILLV